MKFRLFALATFCVLLVASLLACDKGKGAGNDEDKDTVWTWAKCQKEGWDKESIYWHPCDSLQYIDVRMACVWESGPDSVYLQEAGLQQWQVNIHEWSGLKKLSPRVKDLRFARVFYIRNSPNLTELPPEIWEIPDLELIGFDSLPKLKKIPDVTKPNNVTQFEAVYLSLPFPNGLEYTKINRVTWLHSKLDSISSKLRVIGPQIEELNMGYDSLKSLPVWITEFKKMHSFTVQHNQIKALPDSIGALSKTLRFFNFTDNDLDSLPESFCEFDSQLPLPNGLDSIERTIYDSGNHLCTNAAWPSCTKQETIDLNIPYQNCP